MLTVRSRRSPGGSHFARKNIAFTRVLLLQELDISCGPPALRYGAGGPPLAAGRGGVTSTHHREGGPPGQGGPQNPKSKTSILKFQNSIFAHEFTKYRGFMSNGRIGPGHKCETFFIEFRTPRTPGSMMKERYRGLRFRSLVRLQPIIEPGVGGSGKI